VRATYRYGRWNGSALAVQLPYLLAQRSEIIDPLRSHASGLRLPVSPVAALGLGCVETRRRASAGEETSFKLPLGGKKFASKSDLNRPKKNHSRCFSTFCVFTRPRSIATGWGKLQVQRCPQCPVSDGRPEKGGLSLGPLPEVAGLFDHLVGAGEEGFGDGQPERLGGL
jgi:hypothetical protein